MAYYSYYSRTEVLGKDGDRAFYLDEERNNTIRKCMIVSHYRRNLYEHMRISTHGLIRHVSQVHVFASSPIRVMSSDEYGPLWCWIESDPQYRNPDNHWEIPGP